MRNLAFKEPQDYNYLQGVLTEILNDSGETGDGEYDWVKCVWKTMEHQQLGELVLMRAEAGWRARKQHQEPELISASTASSVLKKQAPPSVMITHVAGPAGKRHRTNSVPATAQSEPHRRYTTRHLSVPNADVSSYGQSSLEELGSDQYCVGISIHKRPSEILATCYFTAGRVWKK